MTRFPTYLILLCMAPQFTAGRAAVPNEMREYDVRVDGQSAGFYRLTIALDPQGRTVVMAQADVRVRHLLFSYTYLFSSFEVWQDGRLLSFQGTSVDDGKKAQVSAVFVPDGPRISVNGRSRAGKPCAWTTTFSQLAHSAQENPSGHVFDVDTGRELDVRLERIGQHEVVVGGQTLQVQRYRLSGGMSAELWFDESGRLARQESMDDGHRIEWVLKSVQTNTAP